MRASLTLLLFLGLAAPASALNPVQRENSRRGDPGWMIPADGGTVITGYASQASLLPGHSLQLHVSAPPGSRYRVLIYRLGWYGGAGGRLVRCTPGCRSSHVAVPQPQPAPPRRRTHLVLLHWKVTDRVTLPRTAVSGYYEAKLKIVGGPHKGAVGGVPMVVRERRARAAVLIQVPVNTWQAYNSWGGWSLYGRRGVSHATEVSFNRPYYWPLVHDMALNLELPWVRFLERTGIDVAYQTDIDSDRRPSSLLQHRLVFSTGHDEYWTQRMRDAFNRAKALATNLMFGSNSELWRIRYAEDHRRIIEWRNSYADPARDMRYDTGEFRFFGEPECRLMGVEYQDYAQRALDSPPTGYRVVGAATDPWLSAAKLKPGDVVSGVVGYEWDSLVPGCASGHLVRLMHAVDNGSDGKPRSADMVRITAPSGARVFAMGTMELAWRLDDFTGGKQPDPRLRAFVLAALRDLTRPAPPAWLRARRVGSRLLITVKLRSSDPRIRRVSVWSVKRHRGCADALHHRCRLSSSARGQLYQAVAIDPWDRSAPLVVRVRTHR